MIENLKQKEFEQKLQEEKAKLQHIRDNSNIITIKETSFNDTNKHNDNNRTISFISNDERLHKIIDNTPISILDCTLEKYIIIGNMVMNYASITESKETMKNILIPINSDIIIPLKTEIESIRQQLKMIIPTISTPAKKGDITQKAIYENLTEYFMDDSFEDVSCIGKYSDIKSTIPGYDNHILIETKEYTDTIPTTQVEKFWRDMEIRDCKYGIFISMRSGISKISSSLKIETKNGRTVMFVVNSELNWKGHIFAYYTMRKILEFEINNIKNISNVEVIKIIPSINKKLLEIGKDIKLLDELINIIEELKSSNIKKLESIRNKISEYKRNVELKIKDMINEIEKLEVN